MSCRVWWDKGGALSGRESECGVSGRLGCHQAESEISYRGVYGCGECSGGRGGCGSVGGCVGGDHDGGIRGGSGNGRDMLVIVKAHACRYS